MYSKECSCYVICTYNWKSLDHNHDACSDSQRAREVSVFIWSSDTEQTMKIFFCYGIFLTLCLFKIEALTYMFPSEPETIQRGPSVCYKHQC